MENNTLFVLIVKRILRELEAMTCALRAGFLGIENKIDAVSEDQKTEQDNQGGDIRVTPTRVVIEAFPPIPNDETTYKNKKRSRGRISFHIGWLTLLFVAVYTVITGLQYRITRKSLRDNRRSLELLERQVKASVAASIQRQFVIGWPSNQAYLSVVLSNRGKTVATQVGADFTIDKGKIENGEFIGVFLKSWKFSVQEIYPEPEMPPIPGVFLDAPKELMTGYNRIGTTLRVTGELTYFNGFEVQRRSICQYVTGPIVFTNKAGQAQGGNGEGAVECDQIESKLADVKTQTDQNYK